MRNRIVLALIVLSHVTGAWSQFIQEVSMFTGQLEFCEFNEDQNAGIIGGSQFYKTTDGGLNWVALDNSFGSDLYLERGINATILNSNSFFLITQHTIDLNYSVFFTGDSGNNWSQVLETTIGSNEILANVSSNGSVVLVTTNNGVYRSINNGSTWDLIPLILNNHTSKLLEFNNSNNQWVLESDTNHFYISSDNGLNWTQQMFSTYIASNTNSLSSQNGKHIFTEEVPTGTRLFQSDFVNNITYETLIEDVYLTSTSKCKNAFYYSNSRIIMHTDDLFYSIDTNTNFIYYLEFPEISDFKIVDFDAGVNSGIAISYNENSGSSKVYHFNFNETPILYIPADFSFDPNSAQCAGEHIIASVDIPFADSVWWIYDGEIVDIDNYLNFQTPPPPIGYGSYTLELATWVNGDSTMSSTLLTFPAPNTPNTFSVSGINLNPCFGSNMGLVVNPTDGNNTPTAIEIWYGDSLCFGPYTLIQTNVYPVLMNFTQDDTLRIISYTQCSLFSDTVDYLIDVGLDLISFNVLPFETSKCGDGTGTLLQLTNTEIDYNYSFWNSVSYLPSQSNFAGTGGVVDTLDVYMPGYPVLHNAIDETFSPVFCYPWIVVSNSLGCQQTVYLDSIQLHNPDAIFNTTSFSYYRGDSVGISNAHPVQNRIWEWHDLPASFITGINDTIPALNTDTVGFFRLSLNNEPFPNCRDSISRTIHLCDSTPLLYPSLCQLNKILGNKRIHKVRRDAYGNTYIVGAQTHGPYDYLGYFLIKIDASGNVIWQKETPSVFGGTTFGGTILEDIDFDVYGNVYGAFWASGDGSIQTEYFSYSGTAYSHAGNYVVKINPNNGDLIWSITAGVIPPFNILKGRLTDILVNDSLVHFTQVVNGNKIHFGTVDLDANVVGTAEFYTGSGLPDFLPVNHIINVGQTSSNKESYFSPQLELLANGDIIAIGYCSGTAIDYPEISGSGINMFAMKYNPFDGLYDVEKIGSFGVGSIEIGIPRISRDFSGNIVVGVSWNQINQTNLNTYAENGSITILDSVIEKRLGFALYKMNDQYEMIWLNQGSYQKIDDIAISHLTGEIFLASKSLNNVSYGIDDNHYMSGSYGDYNFNYTTSQSIYSYPGYLINGGLDVFVSKINANGHVEGIDGYKGIWKGKNIQSFVSPTPCGELDLFAFNNAINPVNPPIISVENVEYTLDSIIHLKYFNNCQNSTCQFVNFSDSMALCEGESSISVNPTIFHAVDSIGYLIYQNGNPISPMSYAYFDTISVEFSVPNSLNADFEIIISHPTSDTINIGYYLNPNPQFIFSDSVCFGDSLSFIGTPSSIDYIWFNGAIGGDTVVVGNNFYNLGSNSFEVTSETVQGCLSLDTLTFVSTSIADTEIIAPPQACAGDSIVVFGTPSEYNYDWLNGTLSDDSITISSTDVVVGLNEIDYTVWNNYGCLIEDTVQIMVYQQPSPTYTFPAEICNGDLMTINADSLDLDYSWVNGAFVGPFLNIYQNNYVLGSNVINVVSSNSHGCEDFDTIVFIVSDCANLIETDKGISLLFPNPNKGTFTLYTNIVDGEMELLNELGQIVYSKRELQNVNYFSLPALSTGIYYLRIFTQDEYEEIRFSVE